MSRTRDRIEAEYLGEHWLLAEQYVDEAIAITKRIDDSDRAVLANSTNKQNYIAGLSLGLAIGRSDTPNPMTK